MAGIVPFTLVTLNKAGTKDSELFVGSSLIARITGPHGTLYDNTRVADKVADRTYKTSSATDLEKLTTLTFGIKKAMALMEQRHRGEAQYLESLTNTGKADWDAMHRLTVAMQKKEMVDITYVLRSESKGAKTIEEKGQLTNVVPFNSITTERRTLFVGHGIMIAKITEEAGTVLYDNTAVVERTKGNNLNTDINQEEVYAYTFGISDALRVLHARQSVEKELFIGWAKSQNLS
jgi:hypothetical protein